MAKKIQGYIKILLLAGKATPSPPVGPALGQRGVNIMEFCKAFNASSQKWSPGTPLTCVITVFVDKSFSFFIKEPPVSHLLKEAAKISKGSSSTGKTPDVGEVSLGQIREIAQKKMSDMNAHDIDAAMSMVKGTAQSMGLKVLEA